MVYESEKNLSSVVTPILTELNRLFVPLMAIVTAIGVIYCIILGIKYIRAAEPQEHQKAVDAIKNAILGIALAYILLVVMNLSIGPLTAWVNSNAGSFIFGS